MNISHDLSSQASAVADRAAGTGRGLVEAAGGLVETAGGLVALAGGLVAEAGEVGERAVHAVEDVAEATSDHLPPAVRSTARRLQDNPLLLALLSITVVAAVLTWRRRRAERRRQDRLRSVSLVSEPAPDTVRTT